MSFLVIYTPKMNAIAGRTPELRRIVPDLKDINELDVDQILEVYEIARIVPVELKYKEEEKIIQKKPYYSVDGSVDVEKPNYSVLSDSLLTFLGTK